MTKKKNAGFSMVEILISVAIFAILMIPIVSAIINSLNMSTSAKELQYRNEFAEHMMEHIKAVDIDEIPIEDYYLKNGTTDFSATKDVTYVPADTNGDGIVAEELKRTQCVLTGKTTLGTHSTPYAYRIEVDNNYYVEKKADNYTFLDPNNLALGIVEDIDYRQVALIDGTILNYDTTAATSFKTKKLQILKEIDEDSYRQQIEGTGTDLFLRDTASRLIRIEVSGSASEGYSVKCMLDYIDSNETLGEDDYISYTPYAQTFKKLPHIYLMYNPCFYNTDYSKDDYIVVDTTGITDSVDINPDADPDENSGKMPQVNVFVVEVARSYSQDILNSGVLESAPSDALYRDDAKNDGDRDTARIHLAAAVNNEKQFDRIRVFHNIGDRFDEEGNIKPNTKTHSADFWYKDNSLISSAERAAGLSDPVDGNLRAFETKVNKSLTSGSSKKYVAMLSGGTHRAYVGALNTAAAESRGLYQVKIWLKELSDDSTDPKTAIDPATDMPILQGTKGGNET